MDVKIKIPKSICEEILSLENENKVKVWVWPYKNCISCQNTDSVYSPNWYYEKQELIFPQKEHDDLKIVSNLMENKNIKIYHINKIALVKYETWRKKEEYEKRYIIYVPQRIFTYFIHFKNEIPSRKKIIKKVIEKVKKALEAGKIEITE